MNQETQRRLYERAGGSAAMADADRQARITQDQASRKARREQVIEKVRQDRAA